MDSRLRGNDGRVGTRMDSRLRGNDGWASTTGEQERYDAQEGFYGTIRQRLGQS